MKVEQSKVDLDVLMSNNVHDESLDSSMAIDVVEINNDFDLEESKEELFVGSQIDPEHLEEIKGLLFEISSKSALIKQTYQWS